MDFLTIPEVAKRWRYEERTIRMWVERGRLEAVRFSRKILIPYQEVLRFESEHRTNAGVPNV